MDVPHRAAYDPKDVPRPVHRSARGKSEQFHFIMHFLQRGAKHMLIQFHDTAQVDGQDLSSCGTIGALI